MFSLNLHGEFRQRQPEWITSIVISVFGSVLMTSVPVFDQPSFTWFREHGPSQAGWGAVFLTVGILRIIALIINGKRARVTGWMRVAASTSGCVLFLIVTAGFAMSGNISTWVSVYPIIALSEALNVYFAAVDAGSAWQREKVRRDHHAAINS